jgi:hypothetical protein
MPQTDLAPLERRERVGMGGEVQCLPERGLRAATVEAEAPHDVGHGEVAAAGPLGQDVAAGEGRHAAHERLRLVLLRLDGLEPGSLLLAGGLVEQHRVRHVEDATTDLRQFCLVRPVLTCRVDQPSGCPAVVCAEPAGADASLTLARRR